MSKSRNGTTETLESTAESLDTAAAAALDARLDSPVADEALATSTADAPSVAEGVTDAIEGEDEPKPSRRRRIVRGGTIVLVTAAVAVTAGVGLAMVLRRHGADEDAQVDLFA